MYSPFDSMCNVPVFSKHMGASAFLTQRREEQPEMVTSWHAHESSIVSVDYVTHDAGTFVITASSDCTARLFTLQGLCVGVFGKVRHRSMAQFPTFVVEALVVRCVFFSF